MKIAVLGTRGFPNVQGGVETHCENLYPQLVKLGCDVTVFTRKAYVDPEIKEYKGVKLVSIACGKNKYFETIFHTIRGLFASRRLKPDIIHIHNIGPALLVPLARVMGFKVVMTTQGADYERAKWGWFAKSVLRLGERLGATYVNNLISVATYIAEDVKAKYGVESCVIPNGVNMTQPVETYNTLKKHKLRKGEYIVAAGRFVPEKGFDVLISAFNKLESTNLKLVIAGDADHDDSYSNKLKSLAAKNSNIVLTGLLGRESLQELFSHTTMFIIPSFHEGLPLVLLEAMGCGALCLASDIPAHRCVDLPDGNYFPAGDIPALAEKIQYFVQNPITVEQRKEQIFQVCRIYDWRVIAEMTKKVYEKVLVTS